MTDISESGIELLPCPFCNGEGKLVSGGTGNHYVHCTRCGVNSDDGSVERAAKLWNRRHPPASREEGLRVRPLVWADIPSLNVWSARAPIGGYWAWCREGTGYWTRLEDIGHQAQTAGTTLFDAEHAAQADYEQRILSALIPTKPEAKEPAEDLLRDIRDHIDDPEYIKLLRPEIDAALQSKKPE